MIESSSNDHDAVVAAVERYVEGGRTGSSAPQKAVFHPQATMFGLVGADLLGPEIEKLYAFCDQAGPSPALQCRLTRVEVAGTAASVRVETENWAGGRFTDFLNLVRLDGKWVIVSKVFFAHPA